MAFNNNNYFNRNNVYDIDRENQGMEIITSYPVCELIFGSPIDYVCPRDSYEQTVLGGDVVLKNGAIIDLKSQVGYWRPDEYKYYDKLCLSVKRKQYDNGPFVDCLENKTTTYYLFPTQVDDISIEFYWIEKYDAVILSKTQKLYTMKRGGKWQQCMILDFNNQLVHRAPVYLNLARPDHLTRHVPPKFLY